MISLAGKSENETGFSQSLPILSATISGKVAVLGDFNDNNILEVEDLDLLTLALGEMSADALFDVNLNGTFDEADRIHWIESLSGSLLGDTDLNGSVDFLDFLALANGFGMSDTGWTGGDFDGSGSTDFLDFLTLANNFGKSATVATAIPEPTSRVLMLAGFAAICSTRRLRRKIHRYAASRQ